MLLNITYWLWATNLGGWPTTQAPPPPFLTPYWPRHNIHPNNPHYHTNSWGFPNPQLVTPKPLKIVSKCWMQPKLVALVTRG